MENTITYSGSLQQGWNLNGSYNRIQYLSSDRYDNYNILHNLIQEGIEKLKNSDSQTRLDIRVSISQFNTLFLDYIKRDFGDIDISVKKYNENSDLNLIIGKNKNQRELTSQKIQKIQSYVKEKIENTLNKIEKIGGFEIFSLNQLSQLKENGMIFEKTNFQVDEVFNLWKESFGWERESIENLIKNNSQESRLYGLRNNIGELISLVLIADGETTEWATKKEYQSKGYIDPLLIYANSNEISNFGKKIELYVHARYNRSLSPSIKSGMNFQLDENRQFLLTNHVEVDGEYQTFAEGVLNTSLYSQKLLDNYLTFN